MRGCCHQPGTWTNLVTRLSLPLVCHWPNKVFLFSLNCCSEFYGGEEVKNPDGVAVNRIRIQFQKHGLWGSALARSHRRYFAYVEINYKFMWFHASVVNDRFTARISIALKSDSQSSCIWMHFRCKQVRALQRGMPVFSFLSSAWPPFLLCVRERSHKAKFDIW